MKIKKTVFIITILITVLLLSTMISGPQQNKFDSDLWINGNMKARGSMVEDLESSKLLIGKSQEQVVFFLGEPDRKGISKWVYEIDIGIKWGSDPWLYFFNVRYDEEDVVRDVWHSD